MSLPAVSVFNDGYIAELYEQYRRDPASVDESWRQYFRFAQQLTGAPASSAAPSSSQAPTADSLRKVAAAADLVSAIQRYGHMSVQIDPLGSPPSGAAEMTPEFHGLTDADLREIPARALGGAKGTGADVVALMRQLWTGMPRTRTFGRRISRARSRPVCCISTTRVRTCTTWPRPWIVRWSTYHMKSSAPGTPRWAS